MLKTILLISHSSGATGGGEDDFLRLLQFLHGKYRIFIIIPDGARKNLFVQYSDKHLIIPNQIFPIHQFSIIQYLKFIVRSFQKWFMIFPFLSKNKEVNVCFLNSSVCFAEIFPLVFFGIPYVISIKENIRPKFVRKVIYKLISKTSREVIVISKYLKDIYLSVTNKNNAKIIYSSIEVGYYLNIAKNICQENLSERFTILNIGGIYDLKNQIALVRAINLLEEPGNIRVIFIGSKADEKYFKLLVNEINDSPRKNVFKIVGELDKDSLIQEIKKSHCVAITSKEEGQSLVLLESMLLERPVISTKVGVVPELIIDYQNGLLFEHNDYRTLAKHIITLKDNVDLSIKFAACNKKLFNEKFSLRTSLENIEKTLRDNMK